MYRAVAVAISFAMLQPAWCRAGVTSKAAKEAAEFVLRKFGKEAEAHGLQTLTKRIESLGLKYGDDALAAVKKVGPRALNYIDEAGETGLQSAKLLAHYGDDAVWIVRKQSRLAMFSKYGDDAARAMMKHGQIAEPLITSLGKPAATALRSVSPRNARRLAMMAEDGTLAGIGRTEALLAVIGKYGDRAMAFVWRNKGALAVAGALAAFLANPEPFIDGTVELTKAAGESIVKPLATEIGRGTNWTFVLPTLAAIAGVFVGLKLWLSRRLVRSAALR